VKPRTLIPTDVERILPQDRYILSTTDLSGRITSVNDLFIEFSGYSEAELLHAQHNIIRHPDMPRAAFAICWDAISAGEEFFGYIKNMSKDGGFYWVFAHILPERNRQGEVTGFRSVRRCPSRGAVAGVEPVYAAMLAAERAAGARDAIAAGTRVLAAHLAAAGISYEQWVARL
jgi:PAS domain S-box-containing protein